MNGMVAQVINRMPGYLFHVITARSWDLRVGFRGDRFTVWETFKAREPRKIRGAEQLLEHLEDVLHVVYWCPWTPRCSKRSVTALPSERVAQGGARTPYAGARSERVVGFVSLRCEIVHLNQ